MNDEEIKVDSPIGSGIRVLITIQGGPLNRHVFTRFRDLVTLLERSLLDQDEDEHEVEEDTKPQSRSRANFKKLDCTFHPGAKRDASNGCTECRKEQGLRNKARSIREREIVWSRPTKCIRCGAPDVRLYAKENHDREVDCWFHVAVNSRVPCIMPMKEFRTIVVDMEQTMRERRAESSKQIEVPVESRNGS
jgi:hypothetical protein